MNARLGLLSTLLLCACGARPAAPTALDRFILERMAAAHAPGLSACVVKAGRVVFARGYGWADLARKQPVTERTLFRLASVSKTVVAVAAMQEVAAGRLALDADVNRYLPFSVRNPRHPDSPISLRMLMTHTAGIEDNWDVMEPLSVNGDSPLALGEFLAQYLAPGGRYYLADKSYSAAAPGATPSYSNVGATLVAFLVERASGVPFHRYCRERIFAPLGMKETSWRVAELDLRQIATPYAWSEAGGYAALDNYSYPFYPSGGLRSSARQLGDFLAAIASGGGALLDGATRDEMLRVQDVAREQDQALIWYYTTRAGERRLGHTGGNKGVTTRLFYRPSDGVGVVLLVNQELDPSKPLAEIEDRLFGEAARF